MGSLRCAKRRKEKVHPVKKPTLGDLQESLADKTGFRQLADYEKFCAAYLAMIEEDPPTRIVSPSHPHYIF